MDIIAMSALASAIHEADPFQLRDKLSIFGGVRRGSFAADIAATSKGIFYMMILTARFPCRLTPQFSGRALPCEARSKRIMK